MFSFLPILPGDWDQSYHPISQLGKLRHRSATPLLTWHHLSNLFGPGHTRPVPTLCLHLGFLSNSALCVFLSLSLKEITHFMVEAGWRGEFFARGRNWLSSCLGGWLTLQRAQDGSSHVLRNYFWVSFRGSSKGQHLLVWTPEIDTSGHI